MDGARQLLGEGVLLQQEAGQVAVGEAKELRQEVSSLIPWLRISTIFEFYPKEKLPKSLGLYPGTPH